jgi:hypothetical protein
MVNRPSKEEYGPYFHQYISLVPEEKVSDILTQSLEHTVEIFSAVSEQKGLHRYASGKWSLKEVLAHIIDTERIMSYRLLRIARGDKTPLAGFDQDEYIKGASFDSIPIVQLIEEYTNVRRATLSLLKGLSEEAWSRRGTANNNELSARALAYIIAGHELHHLNVIQDRYLI